MSLSSIYNIDLDALKEQEKAENPMYQLDFGQLDFGPYSIPGKASYSIDPMDLVKNQSTDAMAWAESFMAMFGDKKEKIDVGLMISWFANAMQVADDARRNLEERRSIETLGYISAELANRSGAWDGEAPEWFPQPPEWLELWDQGQSLVD